MKHERRRANIFEIFDHYKSLSREQKGELIAGALMGVALVIALTICIIATTI